MNVQKLWPALACVLALLVSVGTATAAKTPPKKAPAKKPVCKLGQSPQLGVSCTANPLFASTICASFVPWLQAAAPGTAFPAGYDKNGTAFGAVSCWWTVNGHRQAYGLQVHSLVGATGPKGEKWTPQQAFDWGIKDDTQVMDNPDNETCANGVKSMVPKLTTVSGYRAYTEDPCAPDTGGNVNVLAGSVFFRVNGYVTSAQLTPVVEQLIAKYKPYFPKG